MNNYIRIYLNSLVPKLFKILPLAGVYKDHVEEKNATYNDYLDSLLVELKGALKTFEILNEDKIYKRYIVIINVVNYLNNTSIVSDEKYRKEVFKTINIVKKILDEIEGD